MDFASDPAPRTVTARPPNVLVVDDHPLFREGLCQVIHRRSSFMICGEADNAVDALQLAERFRPELAVIDIALRGSNGLELTRTLHSRFESMGILVVSMYEEEVFGRRAMDAGALGYLRKDEAEEHLVAALQRIATGEVFVSTRKRPGSRSPFAEAGPAPSPQRVLSPRELEVLNLLGTGLGTNGVAAALGLSQKTIDTHRDHLKQKLGLIDGDSLIHFAVQWVKSESLA